MKSISLRQVHHGGITIQVPEIWEVETETYQEENGEESYEIDINAQGNDVRSINISFGPMLEGSDAYAEACRLRDETGATFIHPFDDEEVIAGQGTIGLEILEQLDNIHSSSMAFSSV